MGATLIISIIVLAGFSLSLLVILGHFLNRHHLPTSQADVALVFGTGLTSKAQARWTHTAKLFSQGLLRYIIVSGGVSVPQTPLTEAEWFRDNLIQLGIPQERILIESRATNAAENVEFALPIIKQHGFKTVVLVMSDFTGLRAHLTAKRAWAGSGITIYDSHAPSSNHWNPWTWWLTREGWRLTRYVVTRLFRYRLWLYLWIADG